MQLWNDLHQNGIVDQQRSELYMRIFGMCSQDFVNNQDMMEFSAKLVGWMESVETRLSALGSKLATHTHEIPPHTHNMPPHTHLITPHVHATNWGPTSPNIPQPTDTGTLQTTLPSAEYPTVSPNVDLSWQTNAIPNGYVNTSGVLTNLNNKVTVGSSIIGDSTPHQRRGTVEPKTLLPTIPPYLKPNPV